MTRYRGRCRRSWIRSHEPSDLNGSRLADEPPVGCLIEPDQQRPALASGRRPKVAARSDQEGRDFFGGRPGASQNEMHHLLAFGGIDLIDPLENIEGVAGADGILLGVDRGGDGGIGGRKEPLRSFAGDSARAEIGPVQRSGHRDSGFGGEKPGHGLVEERADHQDVALVGELAIGDVPPDTAPAPAKQTTAATRPA